MAGLAGLAALRGEVGVDGGGDGAAGQYACHGVEEIGAEYLEW